MVLPVERDDDLRAFYGTIEMRADGFPTAAWEATNLTTIVAPYPLTASWNPAVTLSRLRCHRKIAESLRGILRAILEHYGSTEAVRAVRMHLTGGVYNFRPISGSARLSMHSYGAAIDLDPERNPLGKAWDPNAGMIPMAVVDIFEAEGWKWGGRFRNRKDCMHFQASS